MRPIWKGTIAFGLVTIPVELYAATEDRRPKFRQLRDSDHSPIHYRRIAEADGEEVPYDHIVKGYEIERGTYVVFTREELEAILHQVTGGTVEVVRFVAADEIDPIYYRSAYYLAPERAGVKAYRLLLRAMTDQGVVGIAKAAIREREYLSTLRPDDDVIVLETMWWPDEIREPAFETPRESVEIRDEELEMAELVVKNLTGHFDPSAWHDETREAIEAAARKKLEGHEVVVPKAPQPAGVVDLMEALKASVEATKAAS